jgi:hypothetical protein
MKDTNVLWVKSLTWLRPMIRHAGQQTAWRTRWPHSNEVGGGMCAEGWHAISQAHLPQELDVLAEEGGDGVPLQEVADGRLVQQVHPLRLPVLAPERLHA